MNKRKKLVPKRHGDKPMVNVSISMDPVKLKAVDTMAGRRGRSRFMDEAVDLRLEKGLRKSEETTK